MKKVAIITLTDNKNYGNRLQNYALTKILEKNGYYVETIWFKKDLIIRVKIFIKKILGIFIKKYKIDKNDLKRIKNISQFTKENLNNKYINKKSWTNLNKMYDKIIVGSDQVWNPDVCKKNNLYFLPDIDKDKKIAYAASMGVNKINEDFKSDLKKYLSKDNFKYISVREENGLNNIIESTNRNDIELLIDPTMLISKKKWTEIEQKPAKYHNEKYILTYFLGKINEERKNHIKEFAKKNNCLIINLMDKSDQFYSSNPNEFLYLEHHAFTIFTDSFHACVFAILYERPFIVFNREQKNMDNMNSRIDNLLKILNINNCKFDKKITDKNLNYDYNKIQKILEVERKKAHIFLNNSLK